MILLLLKILIRSILPPFYSIALVEKICKKEIQKRSTNRHALWVLSNFYVWYRMYKEAEEQLEAMISLGTLTRAEKLLLSKVYFKSSKYHKVIETLSGPNTLLEKDLENYYIGYSFFELENYEEAIRYFNKYTQYHPKDYVGFVRLGYSYYMLKSYTLALRAYQHAQKLNPSKEIKNSIKLCFDKLRDEKGNVLKQLTNS